MNIENIVKQVMQEASERSEKYKAYFKGILKKFDVKDPSELSKDMKVKFFNAVDKGWKSLKEE